MHGDRFHILLLLIAGKLVHGENRGHEINRDLAEPIIDGPTDQGVGEHISEKIDGNRLRGAEGSDPQIHLRVEHDRGRPAYRVAH